MTACGGSPPQVEEPIHLLSCWSRPPGSGLPAVFGLAGFAEFSPGRRAHFLSYQDFRASFQLCTSAFWLHGAKRRRRAAVFRWAERAGEGEGAFKPLR